LEAGIHKSGKNKRVWAVIDGQKWPKADY